MRSMVLYVGIKYCGYLKNVSAQCWSRKTLHGGFARCFSRLCPMRVGFQRETRSAWRTRTENWTGSDEFIAQSFKFKDHSEKN
jgi:hypothetical protein